LALKSYNKKNLMSEEVAKTVQSEINNLSELRHPSIMRLYEVIDEFSQVHLLM
jgi:serine/threonine protein kinase